MLVGLRSKVFLSVSHPESDQMCPSSHFVELSYKPYQATMIRFQKVNLAHGDVLEQVIVAPSDQKSTKLIRISEKPYCSY